MKQKVIIIGAGFGGIRLALNGNITGTESGGYTATVTGDASAWQTGDLCFISNNATVAVHPTITALLAARGALDTMVFAYSTATYSPFHSYVGNLATTLIHVYGHLSRQRSTMAGGGIYADGDQSANTTRVVWRNFTMGVATSYYRDTGAGKTGAGVKWRRLVHHCTTTNPAFRALGGANNVCVFEFCVGYGGGGTTTIFYSDVPALFYHCVAIGASGGIGFSGNNQASTFQNCAAVFNGTGFSGKTNGTFTKCADFGGATGSEAGLNNLTWANGAFWGQGNNAGFFGFGGADFRILTTSTLYNAGTAVGGLTTDIDGTTIGAGTCPIGCHSGTVNAYGVTWPTGAQSTVNFINFAGAVTGTAVAEAHTANQVLHSAGGNWIDENLTVETVKVTTAFGLAPQVGAFYGPAATDVREGVATRFMETGLIAQSGILPAYGGTCNKLYSAAEEITRNEIPDLTLIPTPATGGPAAWLERNVPRVGTLDLYAVMLAFELGRNSPADPNFYQQGHSFMQFGATINGLLPPGGVIIPPFCPGVIDAQPYAQGCIKVRFYEMFCYEGVPYRYDFHVKRLIDGPLTDAEINMGSFYSCSFYQDQISPNLYHGSPFDFGIGEVVIAVESPGDAGDNIHLFTNQQYQVAVRAVAIQSGIVGIDGNDAVVISWSSGYQGIAHIDIIDWPCLDLCTPIDLSNVQITAMPPLVFPDSLDVFVKKMPNLDVHPHKRGE